MVNSSCCDSLYTNTKYTQNTTSVILVRGTRQSSAIMTGTVVGNRSLYAGTSKLNRIHLVCSTKDRTEDCLIVCLIVCNPNPNHEGKSIETRSLLVLSSAACYRLRVAVVVPPKPLLNNIATVPPNDDSTCCAAAQRPYETRLCCICCGKVQTGRHYANKYKRNILGFLWGLSAASLSEVANIFLFSQSRECMQTKEGERMPPP